MSKTYESYFPLPKQSSLSTYLPERSPSTPTCFTAKTAKPISVTPETSCQGLFN